MLKVEEARLVVLENTRVLETENVDIISSLGRTLAEDIYSNENIPPFNNSAMDGYAVVSSILKGSSQEKPSILKIAASIAAGHTADVIIEEGSAVKIMTGAPVPEGVDAVVPVEFTKAEGNLVKIFREAVKLENIRFAGEDIKQGQLVFSKGKFIRPAEMGMLAALNLNNVTVVRKPVVSILATGDELADIGEELLPGKIRNINSYSLFAKVLKHGCNPISLGTVRDVKTELRQRLESVQNSDILIISGGVSAGDYDYVKTVLTDMGMEEKFWKVAMKPGKPVLFGKLKNTLVFGLPGNPVSSMVAFDQFVLPAIYKLQGRKKKPWTELKAVYEGKFKKDAGLMHFIRGKTCLRNGSIFVLPTGLQSSGIYSSMVLADCLIIVPENVTELKNGDEVIIQVIDEIGEQ